MQTTFQSHPEQLSLSASLFLRLSNHKLKKKKRLIYGSRASQGDLNAGKLINYSESRALLEPPLIQGLFWRFQKVNRSSNDFMQISVNLISYKMYTCKHEHFVFSLQSQDHRRAQPGSRLNMYSILLFIVCGKLVSTFL